MNGGATIDIIVKYKLLFGMVIAFRSFKELGYISLHFCFGSRVLFIPHLNSYGAATIDIIVKRKLLIYSLHGDFFFL